MKQIIESVPNYSIGNNKEALVKITAPFLNNCDVKLLSIEPDDDYNRTVVTIIGNPEAIINALVDSAIIASSLIDLTKHKGQHKRMGVIDVIPLIPIANITIEQTISYSRVLAKRLFEATDIPVFLYAQSATAENRKNLPDIRKGEFEGMFEKVKLPEWTPDFGVLCHPTSGVTAVGCRPLLIAFNVDLSTQDQEIAKEISKTIRFSSGGYRYIQAGPAYLEKRGIVQVTMNVTDYTKTSVYRAYEAIKMEAKRYNVTITGSEFIGLVSLDCLQDIAAYILCLRDKKQVKLTLLEIVQITKEYLNLYDFDEKKVIEYHVD